MSKIDSMASCAAPLHSTSESVSRNSFGISLDSSMIEAIAVLKLCLLS